MILYRAVNGDNYDWFDIFSNNYEVFIKDIEELIKHGCKYLKVSANSPSQNATKVFALDSAYNEIGVIVGEEALAIANIICMYSENNDKNKYIFAETKETLSCFKFIK